MWKPIEDFDDYLVSTEGVVYSTKTKTFLKPGNDKNSKHLYIILCKHGKMIKKYMHRLVAEAFIPNIENLPIVDHKDEDPTNNCVDNLQWCTSSFNTSKSIGRAIVQLLDGKVIAKYETIKQAAFAVGKNNHGNIGHCLAGRRKTAYGYEWRYANAIETS